MTMYLSKDWVISFKTTSQGHSFIILHIYGYIILRVCVNHHGGRLIVNGHYVGGSMQMTEGALKIRSISVASFTSCNGVSNFQKWKTNRGGSWTQSLDSYIVIKVMLRHILGRSYNDRCAARRGQVTLYGKIWVICALRFGEVEKIRNLYIVVEK
jgi:hypothetical protein